MRVLTNPMTMKTSSRPEAFIITSLVYNRRAMKMAPMHARMTFTVITYSTRSAGITAGGCSASAIVEKRKKRKSECV